MPSVPASRGSRPVERSWTRSATPAGMGVYACALGGEDGRTLLMCCAPDFYEHNRAPVREAELVATEVEVPHAGRP
jgi:hypothetical protein